MIITRVITSFHCHGCRLVAARLAQISRPFATVDPANMGKFTPKRAVILTKISRFEYEKRICRCSSDEELRHYLTKKGADYNGLHQRHMGHNDNVNTLADILQKKGIETKVVQRFDYTHDIIDWADVVFSAGGDGTFLLAASKIVSKDKPLIGINTDPTSSEGHLCLLPSLDISQSICRLLANNFKWQWRQRIRIILAGTHIDTEPIELHNQQLNSREHRFTEHVKEHETHSCQAPPGVEKSYTLPVRALNEVFIGESLSARVSYYDISMDGQSYTKQKSSGLTVCTGTGSSSWHFSINSMTQQDVRHLLHIANTLTNCDVFVDDKCLLKEITDRFNNSLKFSPQDPRMAYSIRDPLFNAIFQVSKSRGFSSKIVVRSRMWDACLVVDGGLSYKFNDGMVASLELHEEDALKTVTF